MGLPAIASRSQRGRHTHALMGRVEISSAQILVCGVASTSMSSSLVGGAVATLPALVDPLAAVGAAEPVGLIAPTTPQKYAFEA